MKSPQKRKTYKEGAGASRPRPLCVCLHAELFYYSSFVFSFSQCFGIIYCPPAPRLEVNFDGARILEFFFRRAVFGAFSPAREFWIFFPGARILKVFSWRANFGISFNFQKGINFVGGLDIVNFSL